MEFSARFTNLIADEKNSTLAINIKYNTNYIYHIAGKSIHWIRRKFCIHIRPFNQRTG